MSGIGAFVTLVGKTDGARHHAWSAAAGVEGAFRSRSDPESVVLNCSSAETFLQRLKTAVAVQAGPVVIYIAADFAVASDNEATITCEDSKLPVIARVGDIVGERPTLVVINPFVYKMNAAKKNVKLDSVMPAKNTNLCVMWPQSLSSQTILVHEDESEDDSRNAPDHNDAGNEPTYSDVLTRSLEWFLANEPDVTGANLKSKFLEHLDRELKSANISVKGIVVARDSWECAFSGERGVAPKLQHFTSSVSHTQSETIVPTEARSIDHRSVSEAPSTVPGGRLPPVPGVEASHQVADRFSSSPTVPAAVERPRFPSAVGDDINRKLDINAMPFEPPAAFPTRPFGADDVYAQPNINMALPPGFPQDPMAAMYAFGGQRKGVHHCTICNCDVYGDQNWALHLSSEKHRRKEILSNPPAGTYYDPTTAAVMVNPQNFFKCDVCNVVVSGQPNIIQHLDGQQHKRNAMMKGAYAPQAQPHVPSPPSYSATHAGFTPPPPPPAQPVVNLGTTAPAANMECRTCGQRFQSVEKWTEHRSTAEHLTATLREAYFET